MDPLHGKPLKYIVIEDNYFVIRDILKELGIPCEANEDLYMEVTIDLGREKVLSFKSKIYI